MRDESRLGKYALIRYKGGAVGEALADDHWDGEPDRVRIGYCEVPNGIDDALFEMEIGERGTLLIPPAKAYDDYVKLDYNHPLAGKTLEYQIELVDVVDE